MVADRRWPWMHPVDGRSLPGVGQFDQSRVTRWARRVGSRTGCQPWFNQRTGQVHFCLGTPGVAVTAERVRFQDGSARLPDEDQAARRIYAGRRPAHLKDQDISRAASDARSREDRAFDAHQDTARSGRIDYMRHVQNKKELGRHSRPKVTVPASSNP